MKHRFDFHKKKRLQALFLTACLGVVSLFGGTEIPSYADGEDTTTEASSEDAATDATSELMKAENGRITFWEWNKVTYKTHFETLRKAAEASGSDYMASMFVMLDQNKKPLCFLSTYADSDHIFLGDEVRSLQGDFQIFGSDQNQSVEAATKAMNGSTRGGADGTRTPDTAFRSKANVFIKEDQDGFSLKDHPEYFTKDRFYTTGGSMGVLWTKKIYSSASNNWPYPTFSEELQLKWYDYLGAAYSFGISLFFKDKEMAVATREIPGVDYIRADIALPRASAKNPGDQSYRTIGKQLNGNQDYYLYSSNNYHLTGNFNAVVKDRDRKYTETNFGTTKVTIPSGSMPVEVRRDAGDPVRYDLNYTPGYLVPYRGDSNEDRWTLRGALNPFSDYLCYYNGYIQSIAGEYFLSCATGKDKYSDEDTFEFGGAEIFPSEAKARNSLGSLGKAKNISNNFYWYVGTPHTFASLVGTGGDPDTGIGSTITIPAGSTYVVKDTEYVDDSGNTAKSDGVVLSEGSTIVIEDGGVLSIEGNFINNGKIINKGGTILVKDGGTISPYLATKEGTIECCKAPGSGQSGDMIIMPGGKVFCLVDPDAYAKKDAEPALKLTGGGSVINYGCLVLSYAVIDTGSRIENRKDALCFAGYNRTDAATMLHKSGTNQKSVFGVAEIPQKYVTTDPNDANPYHTGVTGVATVQMQSTASTMNKGTILTEKTATFNHTNGSVDYAPTGRINLETPDY